MPVKSLKSSISTKMTKSRDTKESRRVSTKNNTKNVDYDDEPYTSIMESDNESEMDPVEYDVDYNIQSIQNVHLSSLNKFFSEDPKCINSSGDPTTNITDQFTKKCYKISDKKISKMFKLIEACRKGKMKLMLNEKQQDYSGIMLDFDIYQDTEEDQLTDEIFYILCQKIVAVLIEILQFKEKKETIHIGITRRPKITHNDETDCFKDGFHLLIPGVKITRGAKRLLLNKLIDNELIDQILSEVQPTSVRIKGKEYQRKDFLDTNCAHVPTFFIGSSTKKGHAPYQLSHIYEITINTETKDIMLIRNDTMMRDREANMCYEFSLNWEVPNGYIKKIIYEPHERYINEINELETVGKAQLEEISNNHGILSTNAIHDARIKEIKDLLDTLAPARYKKYKYWYDVLCVLANTSASYKDLAEYFSRKDKNFKAASFEKFWNDASKGSRRKPLTIGSLYYWAKKDNPERYEQLRKQTVYSILYNMVYIGHKEGLLSHADIAKILHLLLQHKYITDVPEGERLKVWYEFMLDDDKPLDGEIYKWRRCEEGIPTLLSTYISETLPNLFEMVFRNVKKNYDNSTGDLSKYYNKVLQNFKSTMRNLGNRTFKMQVIKEAEDLFTKRGFAVNLDKDPLIRGVQNGVLKLSTAPGGKPTLIQGHHNHAVSKYTKVPYIAFNPHDTLTKKLLITLRNLFPDSEPDSFDFTMYYLSSTIDGRPKESMFMIMVGRGSNGKSTIVELHTSAIGDIYGVKMPLSYLTGKSHNADAATPALMQLKTASFAYYSESEHNERLNASRIKEVTGQERMAGRKNYGDMINFKPRCHHLVTSNYDFEIEDTDEGIWRRVRYNPLKITFVDPAVGKYNPEDPYQRIADSSIQQEWTEDSEIQGRYLGFMVWMNYWLYNKYQGHVLRVPHPHIRFETDKYRRRQDMLSAFLAQRCVKVADDTEMYSMIDEIQKYIKWYQLNGGGIIAAKGLIEKFMNSEIGKYIKMTKRGYYITGYRFLDNNEQLAEDEDYAMKNIFDVAPPEDNFGINSETPEEYYERICKEYDQHKHLFDSQAIYDIDVDTLIDEQENHYDEQNQEDIPKIREDNLEVQGKILSSGIVLRALEEPNTSCVSGNYHEEMLDYLIDASDSDVEIDE